MCQCGQSELVVIIPFPVSLQMEHVPRWKRRSLMLIKLLREPVCSSSLTCWFRWYHGAAVRLRLSSPPSDLHPAPLHPEQDVCWSLCQSTLVSPVGDPFDHKVKHSKSRQRSGPSPWIPAQISGYPLVLILLDFTLIYLTQDKTQRHLLELCKVKYVQHNEIHKYLGTLLLWMNCDW